MRGDASSGWLAAPTWLVDAPSLRETLDQLRTALLNPRPLASGGETLMHDRKAVTDSLRYVLDRLDGIDLSASRAVSGVVREFRSESQASRLRELFDGLQHGLRQRVLSILGPTKIAVVARLLASPTPDVLRILGREDDENSHSDLIAWLLNPRKAPIVALHALRQLTSRLDDAHQWASRLADAVADESVSVRREMVIARELSIADDLCRIDIVVTGPGFILAIENKVWSREHSDQTGTYWGWLETCSGLRGGLFLSPSGVVAGSSAFHAISYLHLVSALTEGPSRAAITQSEEIVLASYLKTLARGIIPVEMRAVLEVAINPEAP
jgi:hypothetical protein